MGPGEKGPRGPWPALPGWRWRDGAVWANFRVHWPSVVLFLPARALDLFRARWKCGDACFLRRPSVLGRLSPAPGLCDSP